MPNTPNHNSITVSSGFTLTSAGGVETLTNGTTSTTYTPNLGDTISVLSGGTISNISVGSGGSVTALTGSTEAGTVVFGGGVISAQPGSTETGTVVSSGGILDVTSSGSITTSGITVFAGAEIEFAYVTGSAAKSPTTVTSSVLAGGNETLTVTNGARSQSITISGTPTASYQVFGTGNNAKSGVVFTAATCYGDGTEILTDRGAVAIEAIHPGDKVVVRRDGQDGLEPVTWVGSSTIDLRRHAHPELVAPIRIKASALAENTPVRDLVVSPEHCLILAGRCVPAKLLVNGGSIAREYRADAFQYYHLELEKHGILIAEGAEAESYLDTGNRASFDDADMPRMLHPAFEVNATSGRWHTDACAPLASVEDEVAPIWQQLADRSTSLGYVVPVPVMVEGPDLHIVADGQRIQPVSDRDSRYVFAVPAGVKSVSLVSRFCIPADKMVSGLRDTRRLGVSVNWIAIRSNDHEAILSADHPALRDGWNDAELAGGAMWRWTNGAATIPWENVAGPAVVTVRCEPVDLYPVYDEKLALVA
jgi:antigen 43